LQADHLSPQRLRESLIDGLGKEFQSLRGEIWKLMCRVQTSKLQYSADVYFKFLKNANPEFNSRILNDIHRSRFACPDFTLLADSG
jgi:hypothetical protein